MCEVYPSLDLNINEWMCVPVYPRHSLIRIPSGIGLPRMRTSSPFFPVSAYVRIHASLGWNTIRVFRDGSHAFGMEGGRFHASKSGWSRWKRARQPLLDDKNEGHEGMNQGRPKLRRYQILSSIAFVHVERFTSSRSPVFDISSRRPKEQNKTKNRTPSFSFRKGFHGSSMHSLYLQCANRALGS